MRGCNLVFLRSEYEQGIKWPSRCPPIIVTESKSFVDILCGSECECGYCVYFDFVCKCVRNFLVRSSSLYQMFECGC